MKSTLLKRLEAGNKVVFSRKLVFELLVLSLLISGCGTEPRGPQPGWLQPAPVHENLLTSQSLLISPVHGLGSPQLKAQSIDSGPQNLPVVWNDDFQKNLGHDLAESGLFKTIQTHGAARFVLHSEIKQQTINRFQATFDVVYRLADSLSGSDLWVHRIVTTRDIREGDSGGSVGDSQQASKALRLASRDNIRALLIYLRQQMAQGIYSVPQ